MAQSKTKIPSKKAPSKTKSPRTTTAPSTIKAGGGKKIGIFGLDNAGKTTIIEVLEDQKDLQSLATLQPTVRVKVHELLNLSPDWVMWDFGGQAAYRKEYLAMPQRYFYDLALLIFVIDVQDPSRYDASVQYLADCLKFAAINSPNHETLILLHKVDPDVINTPVIQQNLQHLQNQVSKILSQQNRAGKIYTSTIFDATLQLKDANLGKLDTPSTLAALTQEVKKTHQQMQGRPESAEAKGAAAAAGQNPPAKKTLQELSLERKRILEEFRRLIKK